MSSSASDWESPAVEPTSAPPRRRGLAWVAWPVIILTCALTILTHHLEPPADEEDGDGIGLILMKLQAQYAVGVADLLPINGRDLYASIQVTLDAGTVDQRQRFVILAGNMAGPDEAAQQLEELDLLISGENQELSDPQALIQRILHQLYAAGEGDEAEPLSRADRELLVDRFGWFGEVALAGNDAEAREAVLRPARVVAAVVVSAAVLGVLGGVVGLVGLILLIVFTASGRIRSALGPPRPSHAVYAETFAVWMLLFLGLQVAASLVVSPESEMGVIVIVFFASLGALAWPVLRGVPWSDVRRDVGLNLGRIPWLEPLIGLGGYLATLPLLAVGVCIMLALMWVQSFFIGEPPTFGPTGGPAHPLIERLVGPDLWPKLQLLLLAAVAAPIVEETMFRGVLYRHLRDASARFGLVVSVLLSVAVSGFIFAAIHPQGFVAIPALMSLACGMALVREWRGTLVPSIVIHGVSNGLIMSILIVVLGV